MNDYDSRYYIFSLPFPSGGSARKKQKLLHNDPCEEVNEVLPSPVIRLISGNW